MARYRLSCAIDEVSVNSFDEAYEEARNRIGVMVKNGYNYFILHNGILQAKILINDEFDLIWTDPTGHPLQCSLEVDRQFLPAYARE